MASNDQIVVISDVDGTIGSDCLQQLSNCGVRGVLSSGDALRSVDETINRHGKIDMLLVVMPWQRKLDFVGNHFDGDDWARMMSQDLEKTFLIVKKVWPLMRKQQYGRIVLVAASESDSIATSAGRFALLGLTHTLALEGRKYAIEVNVITNQNPLYVTGMSGTKDPKGFAKSIGAFAVALLHSENFHKSGALFQASERGICELRWQRSQGVLLNPDKRFTAAALSKRWHEVQDFAGSTLPEGPVDFASILPRAKKLSESSPISEIRFDGKVVIVTGAASGLGRCYAKSFASLGATVVVSDVSDPNPVVEEIKAAGYNATGCRASCQNAQTIVDCAIRQYGRIDILINNAGFLRDKAFVNMDKKMWQDVLDVHLDGMYQMTKAVWPHFIAAGGGSIVNTASTSGIYGVFGQANYSAAKLGVLGLSEATARVGADLNIRVNTIAPVASTGALAAAWADTSEEAKDVVMKAEYNVPAVLLLSAGSINGHKNSITGGLFEIGCGQHKATRLRPVAGVLFKDVSELTPETLIREWHEDALTKIEFCKDAAMASTLYFYDDRDVILYNLSAGATRADIPLIYERSPLFKALPSFGLVPFFNRAVVTHHAELLPNFDPNRGVLGEHYLEVLKHPIPLSGHLRSIGKVLDVIDTGKAAIVRTGYTTFDVDTGEPIFYNETNFFASGAGGLSSRRGTAVSESSASQVSLPPRPPDRLMVHHTSTEQAALYRLNGDREQVHIDPAAAKSHGFEHPLLHGHCTMSIAAKHIFDTYGAFRSIKARFTSIVIPGDTLRIEIWKEASDVLYRVCVAGSNKVCIDNGHVRLWQAGSEAARL